MQHFDVDRWTAAERGEVAKQLRERPILAEASGRGSVPVRWTLAAIVAALVVASIASGFGRVVTASDGSLAPIVAALVDGALVALLARAVIAARNATRGGPLPGARGRFVYPFGVVDTRGPYLGYAPPAEITAIEVQQREPGPSGLSLFVINVRRGAETDTFHLFGSERNVPRAALEAILHPRAADAAADASGYRDGAAGRTLLPTEALARARVATDARAPRRMTAGRASLAVGALAAMVVWAIVLPWLSFGAMRSVGGSAAWRALAAAFPVPWVTHRANDAVAERWRAAERAVDAHIAPADRVAFARWIAWARAHEPSVLRVEVFSPPVAEVQEATRWLRANAPGANAGEVLVGYTEPELYDRVPGDEAWERAAADMVGSIVDRDLVDVDLARGRDASATNAARLRVTPHAHATSVLVGRGSAVFASLAFDFDVDLLVPGAPDAPLARALHVDAPTSLSVSRLAPVGSTLAPLGASGDTAIDLSESAITYAQQLEQAGTVAGAAMRAAIVR